MDDNSNSADRPGVQRGVDARRQLHERLDEVLSSLGGAEEPDLYARAGVHNPTAKSDGFTGNLHETSSQRKV